MNPLQIIPLVGYGGLVGERVQSCFQFSHSVCTKNAEGGDGAGQEIFQNGMSLGYAMALSGRNAYTFELTVDGVTGIFFVLAKSDEDAVETIKGWPTDEHFKSIGEVKNTLEV